MAKGNMLLGMSRGSVGDVTFYRANGNQIARARNRNPRNPKSDAQVIQRMILATASKAYSRMKSIVDHSFEGVEYGARSQAYFLKKALEAIRAYVTANYPDMTNEDAWKVVGLALPNETFSNALFGAGLLVSKGTLPSIEARINDEDSTLIGFGTFERGESGVSVASVLNGLGAHPGDQITVCGFRQDNGMWVQSRYVIKSDATAEELAVNWNGDGSLACFDQDKTLVGGVILSIEDDYFYIDTPMWAYTVILSRRSGSSWLRSTQTMIYASDMGDAQDVSLVVNEWLAGSASLDLPNARFLNNAELGE